MIEENGEYVGSKQKAGDQAEEDVEPQGGEGYARLSAEEHFQAWHYQLQIPVILFP